MNSSVITRALDWLRQGYASGIPAQDYVPLLEVLHRRLTDAEVAQLVRLIAESEDFPVSGPTIEHAVQQRLLLKPDEADVERVATRLARTVQAAEG
ncbi:DUF3349 domain-containing protein [Galactobacter sp.]|uniref:DUF3349 domain-containing protein n=1 Tax=Galactobacter sp. TaxID=2676125 RepID=UPI0025BE8670|nr:DUF3349 domain-containing protein [Galactobacter sp.]